MTTPTGPPDEVRWLGHMRTNPTKYLTIQELADALRKTAQGDKASFEVVYRATSLKLYGIISRILGRGALAEEVLQEVYIRVWQHAGEFDPKSGSPITWLATIARNRALDETKRRTFRSLEECPEVLNLPSSDDISGAHERSEDLSRLLACLANLDAEKRDVVVMAYFHGMTREEIAARLGRPVATIKTWLRRSLAELRTRLDQ